MGGETGTCYSFCIEEVQLSVLRLSHWGFLGLDSLVGRFLSLTY